MISIIFFTKILKKNILVNTKEILFFLLTCEFLKCKKIDVRIQLLNNSILNYSVVNKLYKCILYLKKNKPIQYILGKCVFFDLDFIVNKNVFIPRYETEELVSWIIKDYSNFNKKLNIIDICTGSGCIAIAIKKKLLNTNIYALDISKKALKIAEKNALYHKIKILFFQLDILKKSFLTTSFPLLDIIVSNPPYVRLSEKKIMHPNVYKYEPFNALFVSDENPLIFYKKIAFWSKKILNKNGSIYFEINQFLVKKTIKLFNELGYNEIYIKNDFYGNPRMMKIINNF